MNTAWGDTSTASLTRGENASSPPTRTTRRVRDAGTSRCRVMSIAGIGRSQGDSSLVRAGGRRGRRIRSTAQVDVQTTQQSKPGDQRNARIESRRGRGVILRVAAAV